jgi:hypothetical protein
MAPYFQLPICVLGFELISPKARTSAANEKYDLKMCGKCKNENPKFDNKCQNRKMNMYRTLNNIYLFTSLCIDNLFIFYLIFFPIHPSSRHIVFQVSPVDRGT